MARYGPKPKTKAARKLAGTARRDRPASEAVTAPVSPLDAFECPPDWLDEAGQGEWRRLVPVLHDAGLLTELQRGPLGLLCALWSSFTAKRAAGKPMTATEAVELRRSFDQLGLSAGRAEPVSDDPPEDNPFYRYTPEGRRAQELE